MAISFKTTALAATLFAGTFSPVLAASTTTLSPADYAFVGQTNLGNQFQVDSGRLGDTHAASDQVKAYAKEMVPSHIKVEEKLDAILKQKGVTPPPTSLLKSSYVAMMAILQDREGAAFDSEYARQQLNYQTGNDALYRWEIENGTDPDLKGFAKEVLVKIDQHFDMIKAMPAAPHG